MKVLFESANRRQADISTTSVRGQGAPKRFRPWLLALLVWQHVQVVEQRHLRRRAVPSLKRDLRGAPASDLPSGWCTGTPTKVILNPLKLLTVADSAQFEQQIYSIVKRQVESQTTGPWLHESSIGATRLLGPLTPHLRQR